MSKKILSILGSTPMSTEKIIEYLMFSERLSNIVKVVNFFDHFTGMDFEKYAEIKALNEKIEAINFIVTLYNKICDQERENDDKRDVIIHPCPFWILNMLSASLLSRSNMYFLENKIRFKLDYCVYFKNILSYRFSQYVDCRDPNTDAKFKRYFTRQNKMVARSDELYGFKTILFKKVQNEDIEQHIKDIIAQN